MVTKVERIRQITLLMASGQWVAGVTGPELAAQWGIHEITIARDAAEASRLVRGAIDVDEIRACVIATLQTITAATMAQREYRSAIAAVQALAGISGAEAPKRVEVAGSLSELLSAGLEEPGAAPALPVE